MKKQVAEVQANCPKCSTIPSTEESFTILFAEDRKAPYLAFFIDGTLPTNFKHARMLKKTVKRYFIDGSTLYCKGFNVEPLKCLGELEAQQVMQEIHAGECGEHQGIKRLYRQLLNIGYYWPTMKNDGYNFVKRTIHPPSNGYIWILTATEYFTKFGIPTKSSLTMAPHLLTSKILSKMVHEYEEGWSAHLLDALWAYRTSLRSATGFSPFSLVYGSDAISPVEITIPTTRLSAINDLEWDTTSCSDWRLLDLEALDVKRVEAERRRALTTKL
ncbi:hypothetical protein L3X38_003957 [Prunus dulcis]|uniref:Integrase zinc-binding domain-containing protein n=1 Tax=Prunus dulcis TaxID=3755 RepID=A0AAD4ZN41_PRUDU|nr:hypothetical protein L3X38_003957 [Prunus dulcis]